MMKQVTVRLFAYLRDNRKKQQCLRADTVSQALEQLQIPFEEAYCILVNGHDATLHTNLSDGDIVSIFPQVGGG